MKLELGTPWGSEAMKPELDIVAGWLVDAYTSDALEVGAYVSSP